MPTPFDDVTGSVISGNRFDRCNNMAFTLLLTLVLHRFGLLATATTRFADNVVSEVPIPRDLSAWWWRPMIASLLMLIGVAWFAYSAARGSAVIRTPARGVKPRLSCHLDVLGEWAYALT